MKGHDDLSGCRRLGLGRVELEDHEEAKVTVQARRDAGCTPTVAVGTHCSHPPPLKGRAI